MDDMSFDSDFILFSWQAKQTITILDLTKPGLDQICQNLKIEKKRKKALPRFEHSKINYIRHCD